MSGTRVPSKSTFIPIGSTHEDGGAVSSCGDAFSPEEIAAAELIQSGNPRLGHLNIADIANILREAAKRGNGGSEQDDECGLGESDAVQ